MGDMIDLAEEPAYRHVVPCKNAQTKEGGPAASPGTIFFLVIGVIGVAMPVLGHRVSASRETGQAALEQKIGSCFATRIGAVGMATAASFPDGELTLVFGSGVKQSYKQSDLAATTCPKDAR